jgi:DNA repair protein RadA/Sms
MGKNGTPQAGPRLTLVKGRNNEEKPYNCLSCEQGYDDRFGVCPGCGAFGTCVHLGSEPDAQVVEPARECAINARCIETKQVVFLSTGRPAWDRVLGGGCVRGTSVLVAAPKGVGKSTSALSVALHLGKLLRGRVLYASGEMPAEHVTRLAKMLGANEAELGQLYIQTTGQTEDVAADIDELSPVVIVWDSIQRMRVLGRFGERELRETVELGIAKGQKSRAVTLFVSQVTKDRTVSGPSSIEHDVDVVLELRKTRAGRLVVSCPEKNRFAPTPARAIDVLYPPRARARAVRRARARST